jgi:hypothetical protein
MLAMFEPRAWTGICETCTGQIDRRKPSAPVAVYCSYWCHLVAHGRAFYTLEAITPWLNANRPPKEQK